MPRPCGAAQRGKPQALSNQSPARQPPPPPWQALLALAPESALLCELGADGEVVGTREVPTALVHKGDVLRVLPGWRVPADGEVLEGRSYINEAMITGGGIWRGA
jgi:cation transport ATPase